MVIKPRNANQKHDETRKEVKSSFDPTKIAVSCMKNSRDGGVIIECKSKVAAEKLKAEACKKTGEKYNISEPKKHHPKIKIVGITETSVPEEIEELMYAQNEDFLPKDKSVTKVMHVAPSKKNKKKFYGICVQVDGESYDKILKNGKINIGWDICAVYDAVDIPICYKCCGFNHLAKQCDTQTVCAKCGSSHRTPECEVADNEVICVGCKYAVEKLNIKKVDFHHHTWSREYPAYLRNLEIKKSKIDFFIDNNFGDNIRSINRAMQKVENLTIAHVNKVASLLMILKHWYLKKIFTL